MYAFVLMLHSVLRWLVLGAAVLAAGRALLGWFGQRAWLKLDDRLGLIYTILLDIQLLVGLVLYVFLSPLSQAAFRDFGAAMANRALAFFGVEHVFTMIVAIVLAHVGRTLGRRAATDGGKHSRTAIFFTLSLLAILSAIPWPFLEVGRPLNPFHMFGG